MRKPSKMPRCDHGFPMFQTCEKCKRIMVKELWGGFSEEAFRKAIHHAAKESTRLQVEKMKKAGYKF